MEKREEDQTSSVGDLLRDIETALDTVLDEREKQLQQQVNNNYCYLLILTKDYQYSVRDRGNCHRRTASSFDWVDDKGPRTDR